MSDWVDVARCEELPPGKRKVVAIDDVAIAVVNANGRWYAIEDVCSHDGAPLGDGRIDGEQIVCPRHGARFCLRTGAALCPPAYEPVAVFPVRIHEGVVQVRDDRDD